MLLLARAAYRATDSQWMMVAQPRTSASAPAQATTTVVVITVAIFAVYFWIIDFVIQNGVTQLFKAFRAHY